MRRSLAWAAALSVLAGLELSVGALSHAFGGLGRGFAALAGGPESPVGAGRFLVGTALLAVGLLMTGLVAWSVRARTVLAVVGVSCPHCGTKTARVKRKEWQRVLSRLVDEGLTRRRCERCHWTGLSLRH